MDPFISNLTEIKFSSTEVGHTEECTEKLHVHFNSVLVHLEKYYYTAYIDSSLVSKTNFFMPTRNFPALQKVVLGTRLHRRVHN